MNIDWMHEGTYYVYCAFSSAMLESIVMKRTINAITPNALEWVNYSCWINDGLRNDPRINTNTKVNKKYQDISMLPWYPPLEKMSDESLVEDFYG